LKPRISLTDINGFHRRCHAVHRQTCQVFETWQVLTLPIIVSRRHFIGYHRQTCQVSRSAWQVLTLTVTGFRRGYIVYHRQTCQVFETWQVLTLNFIAVALRSPTDLPGF
jgi:hypothetical protein